MSDLSPLEQDLADVRGKRLTRENEIIADMWVYHADLVRQAREYARAKSYYGRELSKIVVRERTNGEKSATAAQHTAEATDEIYAPHLAYRLAEQLITADREALRILHAELDKIRTERADARAADTFQARVS